jgi:hypothetical protein
MISFKSPHLIILGLLIFLGGGVLLGVVLGRGASFENLSPEFKQLKSFMEAEGLSVDGGEVRPKSQHVLARARFTLDTPSGEREFSLERCFSAEAAEKRVTEILQLEAVSSQLAVHGVWVLRLEDEWDATDAEARGLRRVFLAIPVTE